MALAPVGTAADEADTVARTRGRRAAAQQLARRPDDTTEVLLDAVRRGLAPGDPVARLLAGWTAPPARPVATHPAPRVADPLATSG